MLASQKAEVSTEFMIFFGILLLFFVFFTGIISVNSNYIDESTVISNAGDILNEVINEINTASRIEGYYSEFSIPENLINGENYNITIYTDLRMVMIEWGDGKNLMSNIQTNNTQGNITSGINKIKREDGMVKINES